MQESGVTRMWEVARFKKLQGAGGSLLLHNVITRSLAIAKRPCDCTILQVA